MKAALPDMKSGVYSSAGYFVTAWAVYAIIEGCFTIILPWIIKPGYDYVPLHWGFNGLLIILYPAIGLILGVVAGFIFGLAGKQCHAPGKIQDRPFFSCLSTLTIVLSLSLLYVLIWYAGFPFKHIAASFIVSPLLIIALASSAVSMSMFKRLRFLTNTWTACILLLGFPWITKELSIKGSTMDKVAASVLFLVITVFIAYVAQKIFDRQYSDDSPRNVPALSKHYAVFVFSLLAIIPGASYFFKQLPYVENVNYEILSPAVNHPNVIIIDMGSVRADHLSLYGYERDTAPNIGNLAKEAVLYTRSFSSGAETLSVNASIFTGMYASRHGAHFSGRVPYVQPLPGRFTTLAEALSGKGYKTMSVVSDFVYLSRNARMDQGFQYFDCRMPSYIFRKTQPFYLRHLIREYVARIVSKHDYHVVYRKAEEINNVVFDLLYGLKRAGNSFFLFINYMDAHRPHIPPSPFDKLYPGKHEAVDTMQNNAMNREIMKFKRDITKEERNHLISQYDGGIAYIDFHVGKLIARLKELGLYENTLIIITSDHGEAFGERNLMEHGVSVYQDQVYVPLIIKYPYKNDGTVVHDLVSSVDIMPTVLDVTGSDVPDGIQGMSLLRTETVKTRSIFIESFPTPEIIDLHERFHRVERAILSGSYKFISTTTGKKELYDLSKDPDEKKNIYGSEEVISRELELRLGQWIKRIAAESTTSAESDGIVPDRMKAI